MIGNAKGRPRRSPWEGGYDGGGSLSVGVATVPGMETLEQRIEARLRREAERYDGVWPQTDIGLAIYGDIVDATTIVFTLKRVAEFAAQEARAWL